MNSSYDHQSPVAPVAGENQFWSITPLASRIQTSEAPGAASWPELGWVFESDATADFVPLAYQAFPPAVCTSLPFQQESVDPYPARPYLAWLRVRGDVIRETMEAFAEQGGIASDSGTDSAG